MLKRKRNSDKTENSDENSLVDVPVGLNSSRSSEKAECTEEGIETIASDPSEKSIQFLRLLVDIAFRAGFEFHRLNPNELNLEQAINDTFDKMRAHLTIEDLGSSPDDQPNVDQLINVDLKTYTPNRDRSENHKPIAIDKSIILCLANDFFKQWTKKEHAMASGDSRLSTELTEYLYFMITKELECQFFPDPSQSNLNIIDIRQDIKRELRILQNIRINALEETLYFSEEDLLEDSPLPSTTSSSSSSSHLKK